ncbi:hypothetical protein T552_00018 [Pneumocystis carinii B80]|uniref:Exocyst complex protein EXO70 n=1 Tax=Pneumocystis carinii (strain B80) TaxID=1408658 RepID=A0A0W4ZSM6_PNEC8|nr:hypothetical protein T552_00018 [Pneumocystis carinii B80]KTW31373.1 hypothetical protein T552_00018 [Pneumocystis carinii B80]
MLNSTSIWLDIDDDKADLGVLDETLRKTNELTDKMSTILSTLNYRLEKVEHTLKPIYKTTRTLIKTSENIQGTIAAIDRTRKYFSIIPEAEEIIKKGPDGNLTFFLNTLRKVKNTLVILRVSNFRSSEKSMLKLTQIWKGGCLQLYEIFQKILLDHSIPLEPLYYTTKGLEFPVIPKEPHSNIVLLSSFFYSTNSPESIKEIERIYHEIRAEYLSESLKLLSKGSLSTALKRGNNMYEKNSNGIIIYTQALLGMFKSESLIIRDVFPKGYENILLTSIYPAIITYSDTVQKLNQHIHQNMSTDFVLSYEIIEEISKIIGFVVSFGNEGPIINELNKCMKMMENTGIYSLSDMIEKIKKKISSITSMPTDGNIFEITIESISRLLYMNAYEETVTNLIMSMKNEEWNSFLFTNNKKTFDSNTDRKTVYKNFFSEVVDILYSQIDQKARILLKKNSHLSLFLLNNLSYIEKNIKNTDLSSAISLNIFEKIAKIKNRYIDEYLETWKGCAENLLDVTYVRGGITNSAKLTLGPKERDVIKEKFKNFNNEFDELLKLNKAAVINDIELKSILIGEVKRIVVPLYTRFYDKYFNSDFSKHQEKYIKYDKNTIDINLTYLFN